MGLKVVGSQASSPAFLNQGKSVVGKNRELMCSKLQIEDDTTCAHNVKTKEHVTHEQLGFNYSR